MKSPERLNWEIRDWQGNIVAATQDRGVAEMVQRVLSRTEVYECGWHSTKRAWFPCDFSGYFDEKNPRPEVVIEGTVFSTDAKPKKELEVMEI